MGPVVASMTSHLAPAPPRLGRRPGAGPRVRQGRGGGPAGAPLLGRAGGLDDLRDREQPERVVPRGRHPRVGHGLLVGGRLVLHGSQHHVAPVQQRLVVLQRLKVQVGVHAWRAGGTPRSSRRARVRSRAAQAQRVPDLLTQRAP